MARDALKPLEGVLVVSMEQAVAEKTVGVKNVN